MERTKKPVDAKSMTAQVKKKVAKDKTKKKEDYEPFEGNFDQVIRTGSTLLDLAISGGRVRGGGVPGGILMEAFGPSGSGKTVLLSEMAGDTQRNGGDTFFNDPEARIDKDFAAIFDYEIKRENYSQPDTVTEVFNNARAWEPKPTRKGAINGIFTDSLAALSTDLEMEKEEGDKMGMRRAKEFSEQLRKFCRILRKKNYIMACSNQIREKADASAYEQKWTVPGGKAIEFYSSMRLRYHNPQKVTKELTIHGKKVTRVIGTTTMVEVVKSSVGVPFRKVPVTILFDYGIDDVRENLQFVKDHTKYNIYTVNGRELDKSMEESIQMVESEELEEELREQVIDLWGFIEAKFASKRKKKER